jgi:ornithine carbamoyltransferase
VSRVPVVNLLSDAGHPIQALADLLTLVEHFGSGAASDAASAVADIAGRHVAYIGDANNVAFSLGLLCGRTGMRFTVSHPEGYGFTPEQRDRLGAAGVSLVEGLSPTEAVDGADAVYTDAWYSMGQEAEKEIRSKVFRPWQVNSALMESAGPEAVLLHCLPAHRGEEVTDEVIDGPRSLVWQQAENRMHSARGLMWFLCAEADSAAYGSAVRRGRNDDEL